MIMQKRIEEKLTAAFAPEKLEVVNDSHLHEGHAGDDGSGETHFRVTIASSEFLNLNRVECQRMVYDALSEEMADGIHALALKAFASGS